MRKLVCFLLFAEVFFYTIPNVYGQYYNTISDGWYTATVKYFNYRTGHSADYTLDVKAQYERVKVIDFDNGGHIHDGLNDSGYIWSGRILNKYTDYYNNSIYYQTKVTCNYSNGTITTFDIIIK